MERKDRLWTYLNYLSANRDGNIMDGWTWLTLRDGGIRRSYQMESSLAENLENFQHELPDITDSTFVLCAMTAGVQERHEPFRIPYRHKAFLPTHERAALPFLRLILADRWPHSADRIKVARREMLNRLSPQLSWKLDLPSLRNQTELIQQSTPGWHQLDIELEWANEPPDLDTFLGQRDWSIYISQPYTRRPALHVARILNVTPLESANERAVLIANSSHALGLAKRIYEALGTSNAVCSRSNTDDRVYGLLLTFCEAIVLEVVSYLELSVAAIHKLVSKLLYLLHLYR